MKESTAFWSFILRGKKHLSASVRTHLINCENSTGCSHCPTGALESPPTDLCTSRGAELTVLSYGQAGSVRTFQGHSGSVAAEGILRLLLPHAGPAHCARASCCRLRGELQSRTRQRQLRPKGSSQSRSYLVHRQDWKEPSPRPSWVTQGR